MRTISAALLFSVLLPTLVPGQTVPSDKPPGYPEWWFTRGVIGLKPGAFGGIYADYLQPSDHSPLLQGQLLHLADAAIEELDSQLAPIGGAGFSIADLRDTTKSEDFYAPVVLGQLTFVSSQFFDRFAEIGFTPIEPGWPDSLVLNAGTGDHSPNYPWLNNQSPDNLAIAVIGQAKHLFSWDIGAWATQDIIGGPNGIPDYLETAWTALPQSWFDDLFTPEKALYYDPNNVITQYTAIDPFDDYDGDGISNIREVYLGTSPADFFNGAAARLKFYSGDSQTVTPGRVADSFYRLFGPPHSRPKYRRSTRAAGG